MHGRLQDVDIVTIIVQLLSGGVSVVIYRPREHNDQYSEAGKDSRGD